MALTFIDTTGTAPADGLFIPITDLPGINSTELAAGEPSAKKHSKFLFSLLDKLHAGYDSTHLGFSITKLKPTVSGVNVNQSFRVITQLLIDVINNSVEVIPVPSTGDNLGIGDFAITDYLPGALLLVSSDPITEPGVFIPTTDLNLHGHDAVTIGTDDRKLLCALISLITYSNDFAVRSTNPAVTSAILSKENGIISLINLPDVAYDSTNPTTGLLLANKNRQFILQRDYSYVVQLSLAAASTEVNYE